MLSLCLIEDNQKLGSLLQQSLLDEGYRCDWFTSCEALSLDGNLSYHIFLVDVSLPGEDGFSFAKRIRSLFSVGIIFLTAKGTLEDKHLGFQSGADDYLVKPFAIQELVLRIDSLALRIGNESYYVYEDVCIDRNAYKATKKNKSIHIAPIERKVLGFLLRHVGSVCSRADIIEEVWDIDQLFSMSRSLDVTIANLRKKLVPGMIETVSGVGYKVVKVKN